MLISYTKKFIFIHNYKVGGTSITTAFESFGKTTPSHRINRFLDNYTLFRGYKTFNGHITASELKQEIPTFIFNNFFKFGFVRNPYDWQLSLYNYGRENIRLKEHAIYKSFENFDQYIDWRADNLKKRQKDFFFDSENKSLMNHIGKIENFDKEIEYINNKLGLSVVIPKLNKSANSEKKLADKIQELSKYSIQRINELYHEDFKLFGYNQLQ